MGNFGVGERAWIDRLGNLRNAVRQELIRRQLAEHIPALGSVLDVGCGQGTQALHMLAAGLTVTGVDPSTELLALFTTDADRRGFRPELLHGELASLPDLIAGRTFDVVCAHGLLMYLDDSAAAIAELAARVSPGGTLSITFRNGHALAFRPGLRRNWAAALDAFGSEHYVNELGVHATADRLDQVESALDDAGFELERWYGVRVFNDAVSPDQQVSDDGDWEALIEVEYQAGDADPYRWMASQLHVIARRR